MGRTKNCGSGCLSSILVGSALLVGGAMAEKHLEVSSKAQWVYEQFRSPAPIVSDAVSMSVQLQQLPDSIAYAVIVERSVGLGEQYQRGLVRELLQVR